MKLPPKFNLCHVNCNSAFGLPHFPNAHSQAKSSALPPSGTRWQIYHHVGLVAHR